MKMTEHFKSEEFACKDGTAYPEGWVDGRLKPLCETLEVIRVELGVSVTILSGYRSPTYNKKIGGAKASQHMEGRAADITAKGVSAAQVHATVLKLYNDGKLPHIGGLGSYPGFTHVDVRPGERLARWSGSRTDN